MKLNRLLRVVDVIRLWPFFEEGLTSLTARTREQPDLILIKKTLMALAVDHEHAWVGVTFEGTTPVAFAVLQECTPMFDTNRRFTVRWFYHSSTNFLATKTLMDAFETWAREKGIVSYTVITRRDTGAAVRCFRSESFGFTKSHITFEKNL